MPCQSSSSCIELLQLRAAWQIAAAHTPTTAATAQAIALLTITASAFACCVLQLPESRVGEQGR